MLDQEKVRYKDGNGCLGYQGCFKELRASMTFAPLPIPHSSWSKEQLQMLASLIFGWHGEGSKSVSP